MATATVSPHPVGSEAWRTDLSDVVLPLPVYDSSDSEDGGSAGIKAEAGRTDLYDVVLPVPFYDSSDSEDAGDAKAEDGRVPLVHAGRSPPRKLEAWEEISPQRVLELMRGSEKHSHEHRRLHSLPRPSGVAGVPTVRRLDAATAATELPAIIGAPVEGTGAVAQPAGEPVIIRGLTEGWRAKERWCSAAAFVQHYGDMPLKVHDLASVSGMGKATELWLPVKHYVEYARDATADAPFYVFQKKFIEGQHGELFRDYQTPALFADDLWDLTPELRAGFSQHRFFCIGGERTGSGLHVDPHFTGAWNTLLCGEKRWVLFPPGVPEEAIGVPQELRARLRTPCTYWWHDWYPRLAGPGGAGKELGMREVVQLPGETIYVPAGWWHTVLNHGWTIAVTENQLSPQGLARAWPQLRRDRRRAAQLARALRDLRPELLPTIAAGEGADEVDALVGAADEEAAKEPEEEVFRMW